MQTEAALEGGEIAGMLGEFSEDFHLDGAE